MNPYNSSIDYYAVLGLTPSATDDEVKSAYRKLAMKWHPDKHVGESKEDQEYAERMFKSVNEAYHAILDGKTTSGPSSYGQSSYDQSQYQTWNQYGTWSQSQTQSQDPFEYYTGNPNIHVKKINVWVAVISIILGMLLVVLGTIFFIGLFIKLLPVLLVVFLIAWIARRLLA